MGVLTIAMGVFIGVFILPVVACLVLYAAVLIIMIPVWAFVMISYALQPIFSFIINGVSAIVKNKFNPPKTPEYRQCWNCKKSLKYAAPDDSNFYDDSFSFSKHCSYECYTTISNYEFKRSMIITAILLVLFASRL